MSHPSMPPSAMPMNTAAFLTLLAIVALTSAAALYSHFRLELDQRAVFNEFNHVKGFLEMRREIANAILAAVHEEAAATQASGEISELESALSAALEMHFELDGGSLTPEALQDLSVAETRMLWALEALITRMEATGAVASNVGYANHIHQLRRDDEFLQSFIAEYNNAAERYAARMNLIWVRPFARPFGHQHPGLLDIQPITPTAPAPAL